MKFLLFALTCAIAPLIAYPALSQDTLADTTQILQEKLRADKKFVVAVNLPLKEREAALFWPVYDAYQAELSVVDARTGAIIRDFQQADATGTLNDAVARNLAEEMLAVDEEETKLRYRYFAKLLQVLPPIKVARYLQIEGKIRAANRYEVTSKVPLMEERKADHNQTPSLGI